MASSPERSSASASQTSGGEQQGSCSEPMKGADDVELPQIKDETFVPATTGKQRLKELFTGSIRDIPSFEMSLLKKVCFGSFVCATFIAGTADMPLAVQRFRSQHTYSLFLGARDVASRLNNYLIASFWTSGVKLGIRCCYLSVAYLFFASLLAAYRNRLKGSDLIIGGSVSGALYRLNMGFRGSLAAGAASACLSVPVTLLFYSGVRLCGYEDFDSFYQQLRHEYYRTQLEKKKEKFEIDFLKNECNVSAAEARDIYMRIKERQADQKVE